MRLTGEYQIIDDELDDGTAISLAINGGFESVDTDFESIASSSATADFEQVRMSAELTFGGLEASAEASRVTDNVSDFETIPTSAVWEGSLDLSYSDEDEEEAGWLGALSYSGSLYYEGQEIIERPLDFDPDDESKSATYTVGLGVTGSLEIVQWSLGHSVSLFRDEIFPEGDSDEHQTTFTLAWQAAETVSVAVGLDHQLVIPVEDEEESTLSPTAQISASFFEQRVSLDLSYGGAMPYRTSNDDTHSLTGNLGVVAIKPGQWWPGVVLSLSVTDAVSPGSDNRHTNLVIGSIKLTQSASYP
jgi:hypothetical protein